jgi:hypothetical protein
MWWGCWEQAVLYHCCCCWLVMVQVGEMAWAAMLLGVLLTIQDMALMG